MRKVKAILAASAMAVVAIPAVSWGSPYAGEVSITGNTVTFDLNEAADSVTAIVNGVQQSLSTSAGFQSFTLPSATTPFNIVVSKNSGAGYLAGTALQVGTDSPFTTFNSPRGVAVNQTPGPFFGRVYVANSAAAAGPVTSAGGASRDSVGDGIYVLHADQSDGVGQGNTPLDGGLTTQFTTGGSSIPFRLTVGSDNNVYITDFSNAFGNIYRTDANVSAGSGTTLLQGFPAGSTATADTLNHGNFASKAVVNINASNQVSIYAIDELLGAPGSANNPSSTAQFNAIHRYDLGTSPAAGNLAGPTSPVPQTFIANPLVGKPEAFNTLANTLTNDLVQGPSDGRLYYVEGRSAGQQTNLYVVDPTTGATLFDSLAQTRTITGDPTSADLIQAVNGVTVSPDNKFLAFIVTATNTPNAIGNAIEIVPLTATIGGVSGLPDLNNIIKINDAFPNTTGNGRDISIDAAGNIYAVSSGDAMMRVFSPGGDTSYTTSFDGSKFSFAATAAAVPEPATLGLLGLIGLGALGRRRRGA